MREIVKGVSILNEHKAIGPAEVTVFRSLLHLRYGDDLNTVIYKERHYANAN